MSAVDAGPDERIRVRPARRKDRAALGRLGHAPGVVRLLCPSLHTRLVRSRVDPGTWLFGHWRVAAGRRREGIGRSLLAGAVALVPGIRRLYSMVERGNEASLRAHGRLGFESSPEALGCAELGALSTIGPPAPAVRLEPVASPHSAPLFDLYARATGPLWMRLFPCLNARNFLELGCDPVVPVPPPRPGSRIAGRRALTVRAGGPPAALLVWESGRLSLFTDPAVCDAGLLARVALQAMARGARRRALIALRGLPLDLVGRPGPMTAWTLMGLCDTTRLSG
jgi:hypothetical protein